MCVLFCLVQVRRCGTGAEGREQPVSESGRRRRCGSLHRLGQCDVISLPPSLILPVWQPGTFLYFSVWCRLDAMSGGRLVQGDTRQCVYLCLVQVGGHGTRDDRAESRATERAVGR